MNAVEDEAFRKLFRKQTGRRDGGEGTAGKTETAGGHDRGPCTQRRQKHSREDERTVAKAQQGKQKEQVDMTGVHVRKDGSIMFA
jgi:hypothetical protein